MSGVSNDIQSILKKPEPKKGFVLVEPEEDELFVDVDNPEALNAFNERFRFLEYVKPGCSYRVVPSKRAGHSHVYVKLPFKVTPLERVALQAALSSDWKREMLAVVKHNHVGETHTCFFEREVKAA